MYHLLVYVINVIKVVTKELILVESGIFTIKMERVLKNLVKKSCCTFSFLVQSIIYNQIL